MRWIGAALGLIALLALFAVGGRERAPAAKGVVRVRVVARSSGEPLAGARVWTAAVGEEWVMGAGRSQRSERAGALAAGDPAARTDALGRAELPRPEGWILVVSRSGERWAHTVLPPGQPGALRLELRPSISIEVEVVNAKGEPVPGAPVCLYTRSPLSGTVVRADERGRAVLGDLQEMKSYYEGQLAVGLGFPQLSGTTVVLDPDAPLGEPIRLTAPATARAEVLLRDPDGELVQGRTHAYAGAAVPGSHESPDYLFFPLVDGRAVLEHVEAGVELRINTTLGAPWEAARAEVRVPPAGGELTVELRSAAWKPAVTARLLGPGGAPLAGREVVVGHYGVGSADPEYRTQKTHPDGRVRKHWNPAGRPRPSGARFHFWTRLDDGRVFDALVDAVSEGLLEEGGTLPASGLELGEVTLTPAPVAARGRVVDEYGVPLPDATVTLAWASEGRDLESARTLRGVTALTGRLGGFELRARLWPGVHGARAAKRGHESVPSVPLGEAREALVLELPVERRGSLEGALVLGSGPPPERVRVYLHDGVGIRDWGAPRGDGRFRFVGLPPGRYDVQFQLDGEREPLAVVEGVAVPPRATSRDRRLRAVDLGATWKAIRLELVDVDGRPVERGHVDVRVENFYARVQRIPFTDGVALVEARERAVELEVVAFGYRPQREERVASDRRVVLRPGFALRLRLSGGLEPPEAPHYLAVVLEYREGGERLAPREFLVKEGGRYVSSRIAWPHEEPQAIDESGLVDLRVPYPGTYALRWVLLGDGRQSPRSIGGRRQTIEVHDRDGLQELDVAPEREAYERILRSLE